MHLFSIVLTSVLMGTPAQPAGAPAASTAPIVQDERAYRRAYESALQEARRLRFRYFSEPLTSPRAPTLRQEGITRLASFTTPPQLRAACEVFGASDEDVQRVLLDLLIAHEGDDSDTMLAYLSVKSPHERVRDAAGEALRRRSSLRPAPMFAGVRSVLTQGLESRAESTRLSAARAIASAGLAEMIPALIHAAMPTPQAPTPPTPPRGSLGTITIGTQRPYVSGLTGVATPGGVIFVPHVSVVNEGTYLTIHDAAVSAAPGAPSPLMGPLVALTTGLSGQDTRALGTDKDAWLVWYERSLVPMLIERAEQREKAPAQPAGK